MLSYSRQLYYIWETDGAYMLNVSRIVIALLLLPLYATEFQFMYYFRFHFYYNFYQSFKQYVKHANVSC